MFCYQKDKDTCICIAPFLFVSSLSFQTPATAEKRLWAACMWLKQVLTGCCKRASRHVWCAVHSHYLRLASPSIIGHRFFHETLSSVYYYFFLYEMVIFALHCGLCANHSRAVSRSQLPKWLRLALWLHCSLSMDNCAEGWLPIVIPFPGMRVTCNWLKTCGPVMTGNTGKKVTAFEILSYKTVWQVVPLNWPHFLTAHYLFSPFLG